MSVKYEIEGYSFESRAEYERAKKEKETIMYLSANTNMADMKAVYKIYKQAVEKKTFRTVFGLEYMENIRQRLIGSAFISEDLLEPIPIVPMASTAVQSKAFSAEEAEKRIEKYKQECEKAKSGSIIKNFLIAVLFIVIGVMIFMTYSSQYSAFTYFTDYKENMRNELIDEYQQWTNELEEREKKVEQREKELGNINK